MKIQHRLAAVMILVAFFTKLDWAQDTRVPSPGSATQSEWSELGEEMQQMHVAMAGVQASGDGDTDFVRLMLVHHQAAVTMAKTQLVHGNDPQMRRLAQEIVVDQQSEIELMQLWLKQHGVAAVHAQPDPAPRTP